MKLGLGTVQFGSDYGVSNPGGQTPIEEVAHVLEYATSVGIEILDTAAAYGDSESVLGKVLPSGHGFRVVTKVSSVGPYQDPSVSASLIGDSVRASLECLHMSSVYGVLLHRAADATGPRGARVVEGLAELKRDGLVKKVGVSVYVADELEAVLANFVPDIVQLPSSAIDQRLLRSGWLARLEAMGVETHVRSIFLQGLLLMPAGRRQARFAEYQEELDRFGQFCASHGLTPLEAALGYVRQIPGSVAIVGVTKRGELEEIVHAMDSNQVPTLDEYAALASDQEGLVNPSRWRVH
jgi:aryl-alcohol dehydrogenase-like predicted oxidoreductase